MKKIFLGIVLSLFILSGFGQELKSAGIKITSLILVHPTEYNLKLFNYLVENKIVSVENLKVIGLYHKNEVYDYSKSEKYLKDKAINYIRLQSINEEIAQADLFHQNKCTSVFSELFKISNGVLFLGGPDLPPSIYNEETSLLTVITDPYRHYFEVSFLFHLLGGNQNPDFVPLLNEKPHYTVYGICLGMQTMNIATGGTMVQDIPTEFYELSYAEQVLKQENNSQHRNYNNNLTADSTLFPGHFHEIILLESNPFIGKEKIEIAPLVYSNHHQAIEKLGRDLKIVASSMDQKVVEGLTHKKYPNVLGIQFHPEGTYLYNPEIKFKVNQTSEAVSGFEILKNRSSYDFHLAYWKEFSRKLMMIQVEK